MPEMDGFAVLEKFKGAPLPVIIFVSAYDQFAVRAFDIQAVDYLLKPFDRARFQTAFKRAVERLEAIASPRGQSASSGRPRQLQGRLAIKSQGRISFLPTSEISWIAAADNYVELHVSKTTHLVRMTMKEVESQFPEHAFVRISRSHIVNLEQVKELRSKSHGDALVVLHDGTVLPASRIYARQLRTLIRNCV
jgi:two-component system LytT family response regulator